MEQKERSSCLIGASDVYFKEMPGLNAFRRKDGQPPPQPGPCLKSVGEKPGPAPAPACTGVTVESHRSWAGTAFPDPSSSSSHFFFVLL